MPMPTLDPSRFYAAVLADPSHKLPLPGPGATRMFSAEGEVVDSADPFFAHLLADGSLVRKPEEAPAPEKDEADPKKHEGEGGIPPADDDATRA